jgi:hypothetical protein
MSTIKINGVRMSASRILLVYGHRENRAGNIFISTTLEGIVTDEALLIKDYKGNLVATLDR